MKVLVTGAAGFIGYHTSMYLLSRGDEVIGIDSLNDYYDPSLKDSRLQALKNNPNSELFNFYQINLANSSELKKIFTNHKFDRVIHLAAQAGVRYSIENPMAYVESNINGFVNLLEECRYNSLEHLTYASTSSVYGANTAMPFSESKGADHPLQFYAATKKANELMAHSYSHLYKLPTSGLRFFTVYGPWGRPDMALFLFTKNILEGKPIKVFNNGNHTRDFTYVDDIVEGVVRVSDKPAKIDPTWDSSNPNPSTSNCPYQVLNIGNNNPVKLSDYIKAIESSLGMKAIQEKLPLQEGDVPDTYADVSALANLSGYRPETTVQQGVHNFVQWYKKYYKI